MSAENSILPVCESFGLESGTDLQLSKIKIRNKKIFIVLIFSLCKNFAIEKRESSWRDLKKKRLKLQIGLDKIVFNEGKLK